MRINEMQIPRITSVTIQKNDNFTSIGILKRTDPIGLPETDENGALIIISSTRAPFY